MVNNILASKGYTKIALLNFNSDPFYIFYMRFIQFDFKTFQLHNSNTKSIKANYYKYLLHIFYTRFRQFNFNKFPVNNYNKMSPRKIIDKYLLDILCINVIPFNFHSIRVRIIYIMINLPNFNKIQHHNHNILLISYKKYISQVDN